MAEKRAREGEIEEEPDAKRRRLVDQLTEALVHPAVPFTFVSEVWERILIQNSTPYEAAGLLAAVYTDLASRPGLQASLAATVEAGEELARDWRLWFRRLRRRVWTAVFYRDLRSPYPGPRRSIAHQLGRVLTDFPFNPADDRTWDLAERLYALGSLTLRALVLASLGLWAYKGIDVRIDFSWWLRGDDEQTSRLRLRLKPDEVQDEAMNRYAQPGPDKAGVSRLVLLRTQDSQLVAMPRPWNDRTTVTKAERLQRFAADLVARLQVRMTMVNADDDTHQQAFGAEPVDVEMDTQYEDMAYVTFRYLVTGGGGPLCTLSVRFEIDLYEDNPGPDVEEERVYIALDVVVLERFDPIAFLKARSKVSTLEDDPTDMYNSLAMEDVLFAFNWPGDPDAILLPRDMNQPDLSDHVVFFHRNLNEVRMQGGYSGLHEYQGDEFSHIAIPPTWLEYHADLLFRAVHAALANDLPSEENIRALGEQLMSPVGLQQLHASAYAFSNNGLPGQRIGGNPQRPQPRLVVLKETAM